MIRISKFLTYCNNQNPTKTIYGGPTTICIESPFLIYLLFYKEYKPNTYLELTENSLSNLIKIFKIYSPLFETYYSKPITNMFCNYKEENLKGVKFFYYESTRTNSTND